MCMMHIKISELLQPREKGRKLKKTCEDLFLKYKYY